MICADGDGVLVVRPQYLASTIEKAEGRVKHETEVTAAIEGGKSLFELHDLDAGYSQSGVREIDGHWDDD